MQDILESWNPAGKFLIHCSNCLNCKVREVRPGMVLVYCAQGYGDERYLIQLIRPHNPRGWRIASECPDFICMSDIHANGVSK
jgi:hypothetical protein